jgi:hypothetical protein
MYIDSSPDGVEQEVIVEEGVVEDGVCSLTVWLIGNQLGKTSISHLPPSPFAPKSSSMRAVPLPPGRRGEYFNK